VKKAGHRYVKINNAMQANWVNPEGGITLDFDTGNFHRSSNNSHASGVIAYPNGWYRMWWEDKTEPVGSGTNGEIKTIRVTNGYTKNANDTGTAAAGPSNPYVSVTMILGATSKGITVTRP